MKKWLGTTIAVTGTAFLALAFVTMYALMKENQALHAQLGKDPSMSMEFAAQADNWASVVSTTTTLAMLVGLSGYITAGVWYLTTRWNK